MSLGRSSRQLGRWRLLVAGASVVLPWTLRRWVLRTVCGYRLHETSRIGIAWVACHHLSMGPHTSIGHLTVARGLRNMWLAEDAAIGRLNWISGYPLADLDHFAHDATREPDLILHEGAAVTNRHIIDCTNRVTLGALTTVAGYRSQILTHSIDLKRNRQDSRPITLGARCFIGTGCIILGGVELPQRSVVSAGATVTKGYGEPGRVYEGVPARPVRDFDPEARYFSRIEGYVT